MNTTVDIQGSWTCLLDVFVSLHALWRESGWSDCIKCLTFRSLKSLFGSLNPTPSAYGGTREGCWISWLLLVTSSKDVWKRSCVSGFLATLTQCKPCQLDPTDPRHRVWAEPVPPDLQGQNSIVFPQTEALCLAPVVCFSANTNDLNWGNASH